jgi:hypothetical protein
MLEDALVFHGVVAVIIILVIVAIIVAGVYTLLRGAGRAGRDIANKASRKTRR